MKICEILPREQQGILACCNPIPPLVRQYINEIHRIILDARSRQGDSDRAMELLDDEYGAISGRVRSNLTIDLTNDQLIDDSGIKPGHHLNVGHDHHQIVPLLSWSQFKKKFELFESSRKFKSSESGHEHEQMEIQNIKEQNERDDTSISPAILSTLADMFISNLADHIEQETKQKQKMNKVDKLFQDYVSPFQRVKKM